MRNKIITKILAVLMIISFSLITSAFNIKAYAENNELIVDNGILKGIQYKGGNFVKVDSENQLDSKLIIKKMQIKNDELILEAVIENKNMQNLIQATGKIYYSQNMMLKKTRSLTVLFNNEGDYKILSFIIENNANEGLLLPVNRKLKNKTVAKIAVLCTNTDDIFYFEDVFPSINKLSSLYNLAKEPAETYNKDKVDKSGIEIGNTNIDESDKVGLSENWFMPFIANSNTSQLEETKDVSHKESQIVSLTTTSPVPGVPVSDFTTLGKKLFTADNAYGYYKNTVEWPVGSGNRLTTLLKWGYTVNPPSDTRNNTAVNGGIQLSIETEAQYIYLAYNGSIQLFDNSANLRVRNAYIQVGIGTGNTDIMYRISREEQLYVTNINFDIIAAVGLLPFAQNYTNAVDFFRSIISRDEVLAPTYLYPMSVKEQEKQKGNTVRAFKLSALSNSYLNTEGHRLLLMYDVCVPTDRTKVLGSRTIYNKFYFEIYSRHPVWLTYSVLEATVDKTITKNYYIQ
ncbi:hypothetical protein Calkro_2150 [Caldicellulosiruptor kronotskyensis 2002]|uniref:Uncharacterized protein n=1 Tax=Caldicellulosiruptor kronotskyensis (strain DSM 18902 / VKM B-2412 / 2002) TaxID=632348 RepID=E4SGW6_CALK2|nr:hypothetical protein [Caldicellulosiruptor kronotskyensis]ADQ46991.1 hypothetical protein Calkro_2150 [Caldicellulosiruptor kronotskyensis 2002]